MTDEGCVELCSAIMLQAIKDYKAAIVAKNYYEIKKIESFFHGEFCGLFAHSIGLDIDVMLDKIRKEYKYG